MDTLHNGQPLYNRHYSGTSHNGPSHQWTTFIQRTLAMTPIEITIVQSISLNPPQVNLPPRLWLGCNDYVTR